ncbi:MAG: hypothetical protein DRN71_00585 [Candidatus Nanohalarchaeota archaeon]|nr:MAG: hypothetical protein DRN71_00585 [Candidatus Nanohaloarchaeota archaeon]
MTDIDNTLPEKEIEQFSKNIKRQIEETSNLISTLESRIKFIGKVKINEYDIGKSILEYKDEVQNIEHSFIDLDSTIRCASVYEQLEHKGALENLENRFIPFRNALNKHDKP